MDYRELLCECGLLDSDHLIFFSLVTCSCGTVGLRLVDYSIGMDIFHACAVDALDTFSASPEVFNEILTNSGRYHKQSLTYVILLYHRLFLTTCYIARLY